MSDIQKRINELRQKAERSRALARMNNDERTVTSLNAYAIELEAEAASLAISTELPSQALPVELGNEPHTTEAEAALKIDVPEDGSGSS